MGFKLELDQAATKAQVQEGPTVGTIIESIESDHQVCSIMQNLTKIRIGTHFKRIIYFWRQLVTNPNLFLVSNAHSSTFVICTITTPNHQLPTS